MFKHLVILFILYSTISQAQTDIEFVIEKIKTNYPGYTEKTSRENFDKYVSSVLKKNRKDTFKAMALIVDFFHDRHLDLFRNADSIDTESCKQNLQFVKKYFAKPGRKRKYEGYWLSERGHCIIALIQSSPKPLRYKGYVIEHRDSITIPPGLILYDFEQQGINEFFTRATMSLNRATMYVHSKFRNDSIFTAGPYNKWKKLNQYKSPALFKIPLLPDSTTGRWLNENSYLVTIPASTERNGIILDSLLRKSTSVKNKPTNLIIDIRGNTGGNFSAYTALLPLIYTDTILDINTSLYITNDLVKKHQLFIEEYIQNGNIDSSYLKSWQAFIKMEEDSIGKFYTRPQDSLVYTHLEYPKRVGFIVNFSCQSAAEMILLLALQSNKVLLFGENTGGAIDYLNFSPITTPSGKYQLYIAASKRNLTKGEKALDGIGIKPHVFISDREKDWVDFVKRYYDTTK